MYPIVSKNEFVTVTEAYATMSDGVKLYTRYAVPSGTEKCPAIYIRTPYDSSHNGLAHDIESYKDDLFIGRGYAVVLQHCRGTGDSEGECVPYEESEDGLETLDYIRTLPFYNGEIYILGSSYLSTVHLCYLSKKQNDIKGACLQIQTDRMYHRNFRNGCNYKLNNAMWWARMLNKRFPEQNRDQMFKLPYIDSAKRVFGVDVPEFTESLIHNTCDEYWTQDSRWNALDSFDFPTLFVEGWYDFYIDGMMSMWERLPAKAKVHSAMLVGPYGHALSIRDRAEYPLKNGNLPDDYIVEWFESIRQNRPFRYAELGKVTYYSIASDEWRTSIYPQKNSAVSRLWLSENGKLIPQETKGKSFSYIYDPNAIKKCYKSGDIYKAHKPGEVDGVISFISGIYETEERFFGKVKFHLNVSSDCEDTAFFMRLYFVSEGESYNLTETVGSLSYLVGDYTPHEKVAIELETPAIAFTVKPGMRIRVDISSESGVYLPHPNVKGHFAYVTDTKIANNTIYTKGSYVDISYEK